jgi:hypothetical protein
LPFECIHVSPLRTRSCCCRMPRTESESNLNVSIRAHTIKSKTQCELALSDAKREALPWTEHVVVEAGRRSVIQTIKRSFEFARTEPFRR